MNLKELFAVAGVSIGTAAITSLIFHKISENYVLFNVSAQLDNLITSKLNPLRYDNDRTRSECADLRRQMNELRSDIAYSRYYTACDDARADYNFDDDDNSNDKFSFNQNER